MNILEEKILQRIDEYAKYDFTSVADKHNDIKFSVMSTGHYTGRRLYRKEEEHNKLVSDKKQTKLDIRNLIRQCANDIADYIVSGKLIFDKSNINDKSSKDPKNFVGLHDNETGMNVICVLKEYEDKKYLVMKTVMYKEKFKFKNVGQVINVN